MPVYSCSCILFAVKSDSEFINTMICVCLIGNVDLSLHACRLSLRDPKHVGTSWELISPNQFQFYTPIVYVALIHMQKPYT